ncbi:hypothetical protein KLP40_18825 [Hymenobacter sp. NST-14]|uniref:hypothetical protein n=1 Tax=Hymenobacter piscis TaxID=2839984 RepID=UPI001C01655B|nr:hypothetical protein [Hymenobacter piscis]MBT9395230.1 hypothetical protein [Hymenobacter piscis]
MQTPNEPKRPARRKEQQKPGRKVVHGETSTIGLEKEVFHQLEKAAKGFKISKTVYASAAVRFFASQGLDPTLPHEVTLPEMAEKLAMLSLKIDTLQEGARKQSADIGNRLVAIWRTLERNLYTHLGGEQNALYVYLERIEENLLSKLSATESQYLWPLMERVLRGGVDGTASRRMSSDLLEFLKVLVPESKVPLSSRQALHREQAELRDAEVVRQSRELLEGIKLAERVKSIRPSILVPPNSAVPPKPTPPPVSPPKPA